MPVTRVKKAIKDTSKEKDKKPVKEKSSRPAVEPASKKKAADAALKTIKKTLKEPVSKVKNGKTSEIVQKEEKESSENAAEELYKVGEHLVYPMHGVGQISAVSKQVILGKRKNCYILELSSNRMKVMIPVESAREIGIRPIIKKKDIKKVLDILKKDEVDTEEDWKIRYQNNMNKIKSGSIYSVAEVCRNLYKRAKDKELSLMERRLYEQAYSLITNEIALSKEVPLEESGNLISEVLS
jgi:CarD family transcriptional regulator